MTVLGIDFGSARIGIAASDPLGIVARPVETIHLDRTPDPIARIADLVRDLGADTVVVGLPLRMDGSEGTAAARVREFIEKLRPALGSSVAMAEVDERLTTKEARGVLERAGRKSRDGHRQIIDQAAATLILQDYLDSAGPPPRRP